MGDRIGELFPVGGPVPPNLVIGREGDIAEIERRLREGVHTMLVGPRRIGNHRLRGGALSARKLHDDDTCAAVGAFEVEMGIDEARRHLEDDGART